MAQKQAPIFKEQGKTYHADTCDPLIDAVENGELELAALGRATYPGDRIPDTVLPGLQSIGYWNATRKQNWGLPWHRNEGIELTFLETGELPFSTGGKTWRLSPGSLAITRPWQPHKLGSPTVGTGRLHWIIIDVGVRQPHQPWKWPDWLIIIPDDLKELTAYLRENEQAVWQANAEIRDCYRQIGDAIANHRSPSRLAVYINELLLHLLDLFREQQVPRSLSLTDAQRSVELFLSSLEGSLAEDWTLDTMAECCGLGSTRFVHYCRQVTNLSPMHFLTHLRLEAAAEMLRHASRKSITEIAFDCGFSTSQYFATAFRKQHGRTPRQYRASEGTH